MIGRLGICGTKVGDVSGWVTGCFAILLVGAENCSSRRVRVVAFECDNSCPYTFCRFTGWLLRLLDASRVRFPQFCWMSVGGTSSKLAFWQKEERRECLGRAAIIIMIMKSEDHLLSYKFSIVNFITGFNMETIGERLYEALTMASLPSEQTQSSPLSQGQPRVVCEATKFLPWQDTNNNCLRINA